MTGYDQFPIRITAIMPGFNAQSFLERDVASLLATVYPHLGGLIIEDGSTDGGPPLVQRYRPGTRRRSMSCKTTGGGNWGVSACRNLSIAKAACGYPMCFPDGDDRVLSQPFDWAV